LKDQLSVTQFAPADRSPQEEIQRQAQLLFASPDFRRLADLTPDPVLVLNQNRQIVFANAAALSIAAAAGHKEPYGMRPGEAFSCEHAYANDCGCGTSSFCRYCGAVRAILSALRGEEALEECLLTQEDSGDAFIFMAYASPYRLEGEQFTLFMLRDISHEKRRQILERLFFHDVRNTLTALHGWVHVLDDMASGDQLKMVSHTLNELSSELIDEIRAQEQLIRAESRLLAVQLDSVDSLKILQEIQEYYQKHSVAREKTIVIDPGTQSVVFKSDASLLRRALGNMVKNALEAVGPGESIKLGCMVARDRVHFQVHNPGFIPADVQAQIFKLSFSTKGKDRGLGTYSMRLFSERYLKGKVSFTSLPEKGTTFTASYPLEP